MILYSSNAIDFQRMVDTNRITHEIENAYVKNMGKKPHPGEKIAWNNSMQFMERIVRNSGIADDCGILIEYNIPSTSKRIDFIIAGQDEAERDSFVIIELKQWDRCKSTSKKEVVVAFVGKANREVAHPSYQAWSYRQFLYDMNEFVYTNRIRSYSCAYLHNYLEKYPEPLKRENYSEIVKEAPLFFSSDYDKLQEFIKKYVGKGKGMQILYNIENGRIRPSKKLINHVEGLFRGNEEFVLLDEQKVAYETIVSLAKKQDKKRTIIVQGGPGTGKSVISMRAFGELLKHKLNIKFVAPNVAFRDVMVETLADRKTRSKTRLRSLFGGSGQFYNATEGLFDVLIVDEAHRLKGEMAYQYKGKNQVEDIVRSSKTSVFFIDDTQQIRPEDIGSVAEIERVAKNFKSSVFKICLKAQFRCSGAEGFINWIDNVLQLRETANFKGWEKEVFEFEIMDTPGQVLERVREKNAIGYRARMLAGYAWQWTSEKDGNRNGEVEDVVIEEHGFSMPWNSRSARSIWAINEQGVEQIGCVHTSQGLEFDYIGIIVGNDLKFDPDRLKLYADYKEYWDYPGKKGLKNNPEKLTKYVKNIYRILFSRALKGCCVFCRDRNLQEHFKKRLNTTD